MALGVYPLAVLLLQVQVVGGVHALLHPPPVPGDAALQGLVPGGRVQGEPQQVLQGDGGGALETAAEERQYNSGARSLLLLLLLLREVHVFLTRSTDPEADDPPLGLEFSDARLFFFSSFFFFFFTVRSRSGTAAWSSPLSSLIWHLAVKTTSGHVVPCDCTM